MNIFEHMYDSQLIYIREEARNNKDWKLSDEIRNYLDGKLIFIFDGIDGQKAYHLNNDYFKRKELLSETKLLSNRKYVEYKISENARFNRRLIGSLSKSCRNILTEELIRKIFPDSAW